MNECVMCGRELPEEWSSITCARCEAGLREGILTVDYGIMNAQPNTEFSFGAGDKTYGLIISFYRAKPLNKFQIWMYKVCFGIRARNI